ncbi:hypothetical protein Aspvir_001600 [Aspergillus viridinutans]|uniref:Uncharacterized protein n=1 Tax=Aspergillus viridinutans TaxID=75553 RepID=A0A9P3BVM3_ASPVI|nr:uncharacterized protein Aspvir_001600 [Aspergillus viridinutans]GIJ99468.1 hypothetical protein Aspvir_001600 [Aspergillus viridinutans]
MNSIEVFECIGPTAIKRQVSAFGGTDGSESKRPRIEDRHGTHTHVERSLYKNDNDLSMLCPETGRCDMCFGEIIGTAASTFKGEGGKNSAEVNIEPFGNVLKLSFKDSGKYAGIVSMAVLVTLLEQHTVKLAGTLFAPNDPKDTNSRPGAVIRIVLYGRGDEKEAVGACLSEAGVYLQHPRITEYDHRMPYANPQFLIRPGSEMPKLEDLVLSDDEKHLQSSESLTTGEKSEIMRIFDSANTANGPYHARSSPRLASTLKEHQSVALSMMVEREAGSLDDLKFPSLWDRVKGTKAPRYRHKITGTVEAVPGPLKGGILADEMGLGKTLSLLALVCLSLDRFSEEQLPSSIPRATLIITPKSTIHGWEEQIKRHIRPGQVRYLVYHGLKRRETQQTLSQNYDIVITTYDTLRLDWLAGSGLHRETWYRIALDEAHKIRNRSSQIFEAVTSIKAHLRWCLTGTPIHNSLDDYGALLSFIGVPALSDKAAFDYWIASPVRQKQMGGLQKLQYLVAATAFRRTKSMIKTTIKLPKKVEKIELVQLAGADRDLYEFFKAKASKTVDQLTATAGNKKENTLSLINFLRLICNHGENLLPESAINAWRTRQQEQTTDDLSFGRGPEASSLHAPVSVDGATPGCGVYTNDEGSSNANAVSSSSSSSSSDEFLTSPDVASTPLTPSELCICPSAKVKALLKNLEGEQRTDRGTPCRPVKSVIFSQWTKMLDLVAQALRQHDYKYARIDGQSSLADRRTAIRKLNEDHNCTVMLASIGSAGEGVDLTAANYVHLLEPHWNPMAEAQAVDRVHRIGQSREVVITRYLIANSIEDKYVRWVQEDKMRLISESLGSAALPQSELDRRRIDATLHSKTFPCTSSICAGEMKDWDGFVWLWYDDMYDPFLSMHMETD